MPWTAEQVRRHKAAAKAVADINHSTPQAVDNFTDSVETLLTALAQREMTPEQIDRLARVLQVGERDLLRRTSTLLRAKDRKPAAAPRSTRSRSRAA